MKKILALSFGVVVAIVLVAHFIVMPIIGAFSLPSEVILTSEEYSSPETIQMGRFIDVQSNSDALCADTDQKYINLKLFGFLNLRRLKVDILPLEKVHLGGVPIGFIAKTRGAVVLENVAGKLKKGDIIIGVDGEDVASVEEFNRVLERCDPSMIEVDFLRNNKKYNTNLEYSFEGGERALGLWLKDETSGVGMLTYVDPSNNNFAALGHRLSDYDTGSHVEVCGGDVYCCNLLGIEKSVNKRVGGFKSAIKKSSGKQGTVLSSNDSGIFGCLNNDSELLRSTLENYQVGSRYSVKPGKAKIRTCIDGINAEEFDIEIVKTQYQKNRGTKSMVIKVTDKELLARTGGIVHGMSGSPIIQDGKIVGAVTHVMINDITRGYGIYIDFVMP